MSGIRATKERTTFRQAIAVATDIVAPPQRVWELLTTAANQRAWNSTLVSIDGDAVEGGTVTLVAKSAPERTFNLKVSEVVSGSRMVWSDGNVIFKGVRTFTLEPTAEGTRFHMEEVMTGVMFPLIAGSLPDFVPVFETYAADLKRAAEGT